MHAYSLISVMYQHYYTQTRTNYTKFYTLYVIVYTVDFNHEFKIICCHFLPPGGAKVASWWRVQKLRQNSNYLQFYFKNNNILILLTFIIVYEHLYELVIKNSDWLEVLADFQASIESKLHCIHSVFRQRNGAVCPMNHLLLEIFYVLWMNSKSTRIVYFLIVFIIHIEMGRLNFFKNDSFVLKAIVLKKFIFSLTKVGSF